MKTFILCALSLLLFACNGAKKEAQKDSLEIQAQQQQIDSLKNTVSSITGKVKRDSLRRSKIAFWKKQVTLMTVSLSADKATLNKASQKHRNRPEQRRKRDIKEANIQIAQDKKRCRQINDSLRKYQE
jgi:outer membrane biogenesis lipoprotein LolB